jgi:hypothetical protein
MPIEVNTTLLALAAGLAANTALSAWATTNYGRVPKIYINIDERNPPGETECPYVLLFPTAARYGRGVREKTIELQMVTCLFDATFRTYTDTDIIEYKGVQNCVELLDLAVNAIAAIATGNALLQDVAAEFDTIEAFPFFMALAPITYVEPLCLGADRLAL